MKKKILIFGGTGAIGFAIAKKIKDDDKIIHKLLIYIDILKKWNKKINLTALRHDEDIIKNHLLDSLSVTKLIDQKKNFRCGKWSGFSRNSISYM